ncbi:MAG: GyrI-like domain-containing protein [Acidimicrobiales bacterium]
MKRRQNVDKRARGNVGTFGLLRKEVSVHRFVSRRRRPSRLDDYSESETAHIVHRPARVYVLADAPIETYVEQFERFCEIARVICRLAGVEDSYESAPVEGFWHSPSHSTFDPNLKGEWQCTLGVCISRVMGESLPAATLRDANVLSLQASELIRSIVGGPAVQALHQGPYENVGDTITKIGRFANANRYEPVGPHHEIYLTDPRVTKPSYLRTIVRQSCAREEQWTIRPPSVLEPMESDG